MIEKHYGALEYDFFSKTGHSTKDIGKTVSWGSAYNFVTHLNEDSALARELYPETVEWGSMRKTNFILADIFDMLAAINYNIAKMAGSKSVNKPKPYKRPGKDKDTTKYGRGAVKDIRSWIKKHSKGE